MPHIPCRHRVLLIAVLAVSILPACQKSAEERLASAAISAATGKDVEIERDGGAMTFKTDEGDVTVASGEGLALPDRFPEDVYLPRDYKIRSVLDVSGTQVLSLSAQGQATQFFAEARDAMESKGWKQTMAMQNDEHNAMLAFEKGERNAVVSINGDEDGQVQIGLQFRERQ